MIRSVFKLSQHLNSQSIQLSYRGVGCRFTHTGGEAVRNNTNSQASVREYVKAMFAKGSEIRLVLGLSSVAGGAIALTWWLSKTLATKKEVDKQFKRMDKQFEKMEMKIDGLRDALLAGSLQEAHHAKQELLFLRNREASQNVESSKK